MGFDCKSCGEREIFTRETFPNMCFDCYVEHELSGEKRREYEECKRESIIEIIQPEESSNRIPSSNTFREYYLRQEIIDASRKRYLQSLSKEELERLCD